ncbi:MAG: gamma-glutamyltransferase [Chromatiaceae bacterium]|jgi:gamma-glutamyltranspeptidase/glutathione hydrolase|nr:gamma-glutamyltransferase [Chromatiaceae bacterium]
MNKGKGVIAAGHDKTAEAAYQVMKAGGNAFDGAIAALCAACVAEPVLASLGGGGFLLAKKASQAPLLYDFFAQTPGHKCPEAETDLYPVTVDFGDATQEFHIGMGAIATPGAIAGLFAVHRDLCRLPLHELVAPARDYARDGIALNEFQHRIATFVEPILRASKDSFAAHASASCSDRLATTGETVRQPDLSDCLEALAEEGPGLFYAGDWGARLISDCKQGGGHLRTADLDAYRVIKRQPLTGVYRGHRIFTNPPPALGGPLVLFALRLLSEIDLASCRRGDARHVHALATAMRLTQRLRSEGEEGMASAQDSLAATLQEIMRREAVFSRGTTQISVADGEGNLASLTLSNGEGTGYVLPGTGIMLNNMLGEEDINPRGFHNWPPHRRISSMMSPTLIEVEPGSWVATGSSGSNRIRSAVLQVLCNILDYGLPLEAAVAAPRIHYEGDLLNLEPPIADEILSELEKHWPRIKLWNGTSIFFGGAHSISFGPGNKLVGAGDPRRGGVVRYL